MADLTVPRELFGSTYSDDELLTALYLENIRLKELAFKQKVPEKRTAATREAVHSQADYETVRTYASLKPRSKFGPRHLVIANEYPNYGKEYGNGFIHRRVKAYRQFGVDVDVIAYGRRRTNGVYTYDGVDVLSGYVAELDGILSLRSYDSISIHFLNPEMWTVLAPHLPLIEAPIYVYVHGYEADRWVRRSFDIDNLERLRNVIDRTFLLQDFWKSVIEHPYGPERYVFVSRYWASVVQDDMEIHIPEHKTAIIHNVIDTDLFRHREKRDDDRFRILWVRSASSRKYGADLAARTLEELLRSRHAQRISATIVGDGEYFAEFERRFASNPAVELRRGFVKQEDIPRLHAKHGLFLVPTRLDSQGVSRDEAMSSGLVPITNSVTAIPEFVDGDCAILAGDEDVDMMVSETLKVMDSPELFQRKSLAAAERVRAQSGPDSTIGKEMRLMDLLR